jgi:hypothetical protein
MYSKGEEIIYQVQDDRDRLRARGLEWVVDQHLDTGRAEDKQNQPQRDFEAVQRQSKQARERKYDQKHIYVLNEQLDTARRSQDHTGIVVAVTVRSIKLLSARVISPLC